jgi:hypothetical protein
MGLKMTGPFAFSPFFAEGNFIVAHEKRAVRHMPDIVDRFT